MDRSSLHLGRIANIPIKIHWTFGFLLLFVLYFAYSNQLSASETFWFFSYVMILFVFVVMHEFGHALTAKQFGVRTRDVIISPIGGIARLENMPKIPRHELVIALAGPAVNLGLACIFGLIQWIFFGYYLPKEERIHPIEAPGDYLAYLLLINLALIIFNMIPAFPMDGGRVLRSLLAMWLKDRLKATRIASIIGQIFAVIFLIAGWQMEYNLMLVFIGVFVFLMARNEYRQVMIESKLSTSMVRDIARRQFQRLNPDDPIAHLFGEDDKSYLVFDEYGEVIGAVPDLFVKDAKERHAGTDPISQYISPSFGYLSEGMTLLTAFHAMNSYGWSIAAVIDDHNEIMGVIDRSSFRDYIR